MSEPKLHPYQLLDSGHENRLHIHLTSPIPDSKLHPVDESLRGVHGKEEFTTFSKLPPCSPDTAARLCRQLLIQILPAIEENNIESFNLGIHELQITMGEYFASAQGGRYTSKAVGDAIGYLGSSGIKGVGQSSWGPTGFAFFDSETQAHSTMRDLQSKFAGYTELQYKIVSGRNTGAVIEKKDLVSLSKVNRS